MPRNHRWGELTLVLTDDEGIRAANAAVFGRDGVTDVIACTYDAVPGESAATDGDIVVNVQRACARARRNWPASRELALYVAHGCDHLAGSDDATDAEANRMRRRELRWLRRPDLAPLAKALFEESADDG